MKWSTSVVVAPASFTSSPAPLKGRMDEVINSAAEIGFDAIQFTVNRPADFDLKAARDALHANQLKASAIATGTGYSMDKICLGHRDEDVRLAAVERMKEHIDLATALDGADVVIGLIRGRYADGGSHANYMTQYRKSVEACLRYAETRSIRLVHEAIGRTDSDVLRTIDENIDFIHSFKSAHLGLHIDSHHMALEEVDFVSAIHRAGSMVVQTDISDVARAVPDGTQFDFVTLLAALKQIDYAGYLVFEFNSTGTGVAEAKRGFDYIASLSRS